MSWKRADWLLAIALVVSAIVIRVGALPDSGLFHDDAWAAASVSMASASEWLRTSVDHPLFNALLWPLHSVAADRPTVLVYPVFVAGALAPAAIFVFLRSLSYPRSVSCALAAMVVAAPTAIAFSAHVKTYVIDAILIAGIAAVLPHLARVRWTARIAVVWVLAALLVGTFSIFVLITTAIAGVVLVFHAHDDRRTRVLAVAAQAVAQLIYVSAITRTYSDAVLDRFWRAQGGYIEATANPFALAADVYDHYRGVVEVFPGGGSGAATIVSLVALAGLIIASVRRGAVAARLLLLLLLLAAAASIFKLVPFGVTGSSYLGRLSLWLLPAIAVGIAEVLRVGWQATAGVPRLRLAVNCVLYGFAVVVVASAFGNAPRYPVSGSRSAVEFIDSAAGENDLILLMPRSAFAFGIETDRDVDLRTDASSGFGSRLVFDDQVVQDENMDPPADLSEQLAATDRAFVFTGVKNQFALERAQRAAATLRAEGFVPADERAFQDTTVTIWEREQ